MSLYQKYRPSQFSEVFAQDVTINYLENISKLCKNNKDFPHAYIFSGSHGIGKTTIARIFAKELEVKSDDILELDAASTSRKIENIRDLIDQTHNLPLYSKHKVYILDEAHALTPASSTALLKTLEEPFSHNLFILCTTDADKILPTIKSRCVQLRLQSPTQELITKYLEKIAKAEEVNISDNDIKIMSLHSNNSYRDAIVNLEKYIHNNNSINIFGQIESEDYFKIITFLAKKDIKSIFELLLTMNNFDYILFLNIIRQGILIKQNVNDINLLSQVEIMKIKEILENKENKDIFNSKNLLYFLEKLDLYKNTSDKKTVLIATFGALLEEIK